VEYRLIYGGFFFDFAHISCVCFCWDCGWATALKRFFSAAGGKFKSILVDNASKVYFSYLNDVLDYKGYVSSYLVKC